MDRIKNLRNPRIYIAFAATFALILLSFPNEGRFKYKYQKGRPWMYETLVAPIDFPILKTDAELLAEKDEKASEVISYYNYDQGIPNVQIKKISNLRDEISTDVFALLIEGFADIYAKGVVAPYDKSSQQDRVIIVQKEKRASEVPVTEVFDVKRALLYLSSLVSQSFPSLNVDSLFRTYRIEDQIVPNLIYDQKKTDMLHKEAVNYISPTKGIIYTGQQIVSEGEIVTAEVAQLLDSLKAEYDGSFGFSGSYFNLLLGHAFFVLIILALLFGVIYFMNIKIFINSNMLYFILLLVVLMFGATVLVRNVGPNMLFMMPYAVFALYLVSFFNQSLAFSLYTVMLLPLLIVSQNGVELYFMNLFAGMIALVSFYYLNRGWLQFVNSLFIFIGISLVYLSFRLISDGVFISFNMRMVVYLICNSLFVVAAYPLVFLFEKVFSLVSNSRLKELADTNNNKLLLNLAKKAPGTFQHSLQVSNLADAAAREIGGDVMLVKVGALYHDVGKMNNPQCFVENQPVGMNYHKDLTPIESAAQIIRHVDDGVELAKKGKLPSVVIDFIKTHHAHSLTGYFYAVYCNGGGDPENKAPFTYHGELPSTKEQVIVLMADAVEAASRTLKDYSKESISSLVESIISMRLSDSQLVNAEISIKEITLVKETFKNYLLQVYHERIIYPEIGKV